MLKSFALRFALFTAGWFILVGGRQISDTWFVIVFLIATTVISLYSVPPGKWMIRPVGAQKIFPYFIITSIRGGWDVARRVFYRKVPADPVFISIEHEQDSRKTLILALIISLLPGTASTLITEDSIVVHVLDKKLPVAEEIRELQSRINEIFYKA